MKRQNPIKTSSQLISIIASHGYTTLEKGTIFLQLTALQKNESVQSVARWMNNKPATDLFLGELRQQLEANNIPPLRDESESLTDEQRLFGYRNFLRER